MRKIIGCLLCLLLSMTCLMASNLQTLYTTRDSVYQRVDQLCRRAGVTGPTSFSPMPARALVIALERIDTTSLNVADLAEYGELMETLTGEGQYIYEEDFFSFDLDLLVNLGVNIADYDEWEFRNRGEDLATAWDRRNDTLVPYRYEDPSLAAGIKMDFGGHVALEAQFDVRNRPDYLYETSFGWLFTGRTGGKVIFIGMSPELPTRAGVSIGNEYFNLTLGRFPHGIGSGMTGNLAVGDNFSYQELLALSFMSDFFNYNISITRFDQQVSVNEDGSGYITTFNRSEFSGDQQYRVVHRFDFNLFDRVRFAVNLSTLYNSSYGFDFRYLFPFVIAHNYYNYANEVGKTYYDEANNIMSFDLEVAIVDGLSFSAQAVIDQFQMYFEDQGAVPPAYGFLGNLKYSRTLADKGMFNIWVEGVYTNPYLYLNGKREACTDEDTDVTDNNIDYNLDYVVGYHRQYLDDYGYSGYIYGPDSMVFSLGADYRAVDGSFQVGGNALYRVRGENGIRHATVTHQQTDIDMSDSIFNLGDVDAGVPSGGWYNAEHLLKFAVYGIYDFDREVWGQVSLYAAGSVNSYFNYGREHGAVKCLPQLLVGAKWLF